MPTAPRCAELGRGGLDGRAPFAPRRNEKSDPGVAEFFWLSGFENGGSLIVSVGARHPKNPENRYQAKELRLMFDKTKVGSQIYVWSKDGKNTKNKTVVISAHGMQTIMNSRRTHKLRQNVIRIAFYAPHAYTLVDPMLEKIINREVSPSEWSTWDKCQDSQDYNLTKYQGKHSNYEETYEMIEKLGKYSRMDVITIRNRILSNAITMKQVIDQVLDDGWLYSEFHCAFCRGSAIGKVESYDPMSSPSGMPPIFSTDDFDE
jgi:hypothetical protein